jgi:hypothetical protein
LSYFFVFLISVCTVDTCSRILEVLVDLAEWKQIIYFLIIKEKIRIFHLVSLFQGQKKWIKVKKSYIFSWVKRISLTNLKCFGQSEKRQGWGERENASEVNSPRSGVAFCLAFTAWHKIKNLTEQMSVLLFWSNLNCHYLTNKVYHAYAFQKLRLRNLFCCCCCYFHDLTSPNFWSEQF